MRSPTNRIIKAVAIVSDITVTSVLFSGFMKLDFSPGGGAMPGILSKMEGREDIVMIELDHSLRKSLSVMVKRRHHGGLTALCTAKGGRYTPILHPSVTWSKLLVHRCAPCVHVSLPTRAARSNPTGVRQVLMWYRLRQTFHRPQPCHQWKQFMDWAASCAF